MKLNDLSKPCSSFRSSIHAIGDLQGVKEVQDHESSKLKSKKKFIITDYEFMQSQFGVRE